jgi:acetyl esterase/lipase
MQWPDLLDRPLPAPDRTIKVGPAETNLVDIWLPEGAGPHPTVLIIHGGCWQKAIADRTIMSYAAAALRDEGMAVWNIEYRGVDEDGGGHPGTFRDVALAIDALAERGPGLGLETSKVVAYGHSAGGHLALWAAARHRLPEDSPLHRSAPLSIDGVINSGGLADLEASAPVTNESCLGDIMDKLTGAPSPGRPNVFSDTSPAELLPTGAAQASVNGSEDRIAPPLLGRGWTKAAEAAGDMASFIEIPASGHVELIAPGTEAFSAQAAILKKWLDLERSPGPGPGAD